MRRALHVAVPLVVLVLGVVGFLLLAGLRAGAERERAEAAAPAVEVVALEPRAATARLSATGTVRPAREVDVAAEVVGQVVWLSDELVPGGRFRPGQVIARVDPRDYHAAVALEVSRVEKARLELETEEARQRVARKEWALLGKSPAEAESALALRQPHVDAARGALRSAEAALLRAEVQLARTLIRAPFDALVSTESVEVGEVVQPGAPIATLIGAEELWVTVSLPVEGLAALTFPSHGRLGSVATVRQALGEGEAVVRSGRVERLASELDPATRTAQVLVTIPRPFDGRRGLPLLPGAFVEVHLAGKRMEGVLAVPRAALVDGDGVWIVDGDDKLARRTLAIEWKQGDVVFVRDGLAAGDRIVVTPLALPLTGMPVRVTRETRAATAEEQPDGGGVDEEQP